jgi:hypothetical protein
MQDVMKKSRVLRPVERSEVALGHSLGTRVRFHIESLAATISIRIVNPRTIFILFVLQTEFIPRVREQTGGLQHSNKRAHIRGQTYLSIGRKLWPPYTGRLGFNTSIDVAPNRAKH